MYIPYGRQTIDDNDIQAVLDVLKSDYLTTGPKVAEFEKKVADYDKRIATKEKELCNEELKLQKEQDI